MQENMRGMGRNHGQACLKARFEEWETSLVTNTIRNSFFASSTNLPRKKNCFCPGARGAKRKFVHGARGAKIKFVRGARGAK